jgi:hypothetical protein
MFAYFFWHARHMFWVPFVLQLQFRNRWRYICCLLVRWLLLVRWFVGCWLCLFGSSLRFGALGMQLGLFVLSHWFGACCFILFDSALQGLGPTPVLGAVFFFFVLLLFFGRFTVFNPCTHEWACNCVIFPVWRGQYLFCCDILLVLQC